MGDSHTPPKRRGWRILAAGVATVAVVLIVTAAVRGTAASAAPVQGGQVHALTTGHSKWCESGKDNPKGCLKLPKVSFDECCPKGKPGPGDIGGKVTNQNRVPLVLEVGLTGPEDPGLTLTVPPNKTVRFEFGILPNGTYKPDAVVQLPGTNEWRTLGEFDNVVLNCKVPPTPTPTPTVTVTPPPATTPPATPPVTTPPATATPSVAPTATPSASPTAGVPVPPTSRPTSSPQPMLPVTGSGGGMALGLSLLLFGLFLVAVAIRWQRRSRLRLVTPADGQ